MAAHLGTALITGASSGIGAIYADRLARRGYDLVLVGRSAEKLGDLAARLSSTSGVKAEALVADLVTADGVAIVEARLAADPAINLLVNSAGLLANGPIARASASALDDMLTVNVVALTRLASAAASAFASRGRGGIINLGSAMAFIDTPNTAAYGRRKPMC